MTDREENAFRDALRALVAEDEAAPAVPRRPRPVAQTMLVAAAIVLLVSSLVIGLPQLRGDSGAQTASGGQAGAEADAEAAPVPPDAAPESPAARENAPAGWRTEYYRDISFQVPATWGYAVPPGPDWCANSRKATPRADQRTPYVWLDMARPVRLIKCAERPASLLTEHVVATIPGAATDYVEGAVRTSGWWVVTRFAGSAVLVVTTRDRALAEQILDSAGVMDESAPCPAASPVAGAVGTRPVSPAPLDDLSAVEWAVVCQYEPVSDMADRELPSLRAVSLRQGSQAQDLVAELRSAPENQSGCDPAPVDGRPDIAMMVRVATSDGVREVYVSATGCPDGAGMTGGIDDGTSVRVLTRPACQALIVRPLALFSATGEVGTNCLG